MKALLFFCGLFLACVQADAAKINPYSLSGGTGSSSPYWFLHSGFYYGDNSLMRKIEVRGANDRSLPAPTCSADDKSTLYWTMNAPLKPGRNWSERTDVHVNDKGGLMQLSVQQYVEDRKDYRWIVCIFGEKAELLASYEFAGRTLDD